MTQFVKSQIQRIDRKGQIVIAKSVRRAAGIEDGWFVLVRPLSDGKILIHAIGELPELLRLQQKEAKK